MQVMVLMLLLRIKVLKLSLWIHVSILLWLSQWPILRLGSLVFKTLLRWQVRMKALISLV